LLEEKNCRPEFKYITSANNPADPISRNQELALTAHQIQNAVESAIALEEVILRMKEGRDTSMRKGKGGSTPSVEV
jgi:hypothetical protein